MKKVLFLFISLFVGMNIVNASYCNSSKGWDYVKSVYSNTDLSDSSGSYEIVCCGDTTDGGYTYICDYFIDKGSTTNPSAFSNVLSEDDAEECDGIFKDSNGDFNTLGEFLQGVFTLIKVLSPTLVVALSTIDYIKAIASSNQDAIKKANRRTIQRFIIGIVIFFIPFILDILFDLFGIYDISTCGIS